MTPFEYALNIALIGLVVLQLRGIKITAAALLLPVVMTAWAATQILHTIPTAGNDLAFEIAGALGGVALGAAAGLATRVSVHDVTAVAKAGGVAGSLWVLGIGARLAFSLWVQNGGQPTVRAFSVAHHLTGPAWGTAFVLMALTEVTARTGVIFVKARRSGATIERGGLIRRLASA